MLRLSLSAPHPPASLAARIAGRMQHRSADADMIRVLGGLDDALLRDIGLARHEVLAAQASLETPAQSLWRALQGRVYASPTRLLRYLSARTRG